MTTPKLHHYVPQFYLRRFANERDQVGVYQRATGRRFAASIGDAGAESGFYNIVTEDGELSTAVETEVLSKVDEHGAAAIEEVLSGAFPPSEEFRAYLSAYMGFQYVRGRKFREMYRVQSDYMMRALAMMMSKEQMAEILTGDGGKEPTAHQVDAFYEMVNHPTSYNVVPHNNETIKAMMKIAEDTYPYFFMRRWVLVKTPKHLITTDEPVVMWANDDARSSFMGVGLMTADELRFPLDPHHMLVMLQPDSDMKERTIELLDGARNLNSNQAGQCYEYVYYHPDHEAALDEVVENMDLPTKHPVTGITSGFKGMEQGPLYPLSVRPPRVKKK